MADRNDKYYSLSELSRIHRNALAVNNRVYQDEKGNQYMGDKEGRLQKVTANSVNENRIDPYSLNINDPVSSETDPVFSSWLISNFPEAVQDQVGGILTDTPTVDLTYDDAMDQITADVIVGAVDNTLSEMIMWDGTTFKRRTVGSLPSGTLQIGNSVFVSADGDDATGVRERLDLPFLTPAAAIAAALAGDTIFVYPSDYVISSPINLADGINMRFMGEGSLTVTDIDMFQPVSNAVNVVHGPGWDFIGIGWGRIIDTQGRTNVNFNFTFRRAISDDEYAIHLNHSNVNSRMYLTGDRIYTNTGFANIFGDSSLQGKTYVNVKSFEITQGSGARCIDLQKSDFFCRFQTMYAPNGGAIYVQASNANCEMFFNGDYIDAQGSVWAVWFQGTATRMGLNCNTLVGASDCVLVSDDGGTVYACVENIINNYVGTVDGTVHCEGSTMYLNNATISRGASAVGGGDLKTSAASPRLYLKGVSYDVTRVNIANHGEAKTWKNGGWHNVPHAINNPVGSLNAITDSELDDCVVDFAGFTGCSIDRVIANGHTFTFTANGESYADRIIINGKTKSLETISDIPGSPTNGHYELSKATANRALPSFKTSLGNIIAFQPALWAKRTHWHGSGFGGIGVNLTNNGTVATVVAETIGVLTQGTTNGSAGRDAGQAETNVSWCRGSVAGAQNGFFFYCRGAFPDASYAHIGGATGSRVIFGLATAGLTANLNVDDPNSDRAAFSFVNVNGGRTDTNIMFSTRTSGGSETLTDTGLPIVQNDLYDFFIYCEPMGTTVYWEIMNLNAGTSASGSHAANLPVNSSLMGGLFGVYSVNAVVRRIRRGDMIASLPT